VALTNGNRVEVFDLASLERLLCFPIDHVVKRSTITWLGSKSLGVHTDYGCASLYTISDGGMLGMSS
jgi:hypothetical protein